MNVNIIKLNFKKLSFYKLLKKYKLRSYKSVKRNLNKLGGQKVIYARLCGYSFRTIANALKYSHTNVKNIEHNFLKRLDEKQKKEYYNVVKRKQLNSIFKFSGF